HTTLLRSSRYERECMLVHMHGTWVRAGITTGDIVPHSSRARGKPNVICVEEDAVGVVRVHRDSLIVPVLRIIEATVTERTALRAFHISPAGAAICRSPCTKWATVGIAASAIPNNGLRLRVNVIWITWRDCDVDASKLVGAAIT